MSTPALPIPWPEEAELKTHSGGCHCKKIRFEFEYPDIYLLPAVECNCSFCETRGYMNMRLIYTWNDKFRFTEGSEKDLTTYKFGEGKIHHRFCPKCGTTIGAVYPEGRFIIINTRTIDGIDLKQLQKKAFDGRSDSHRIRKMEEGRA